MEVRRIRHTELTCLRQHVREAHHNETLAADAGVVETLEYYDVLPVSSH